MKNLEDTVPGRYKDRYGQEYTVQFYKGRYRVFMDKEEKEIRVNLKEFLKEVERVGNFEI
jgi:hypothetical protein